MSTWKTKWKKQFRKKLQIRTVKSQNFRANKK